MSSVVAVTALLPSVADTGVVTSGCQVRRGSTDAGSRWEAAWGRPDRRLSSVVLRYGGFREQATAPVARQELPSSTVMLVLNLSDSLTVSRGLDAGAVAPAAPAAFVTGVGLHPVQTTHTGAQASVEIQLDPLAVPALFGVAASELSDQIVDLRDLWGGTATELVTRAQEAGTWEHRFGVLDDVLLGRLGPGRGPDPVLVGAWQLLLEARGDLAMRALHDSTGWSRRRLAERFREQLGVNPKALARLVRFEHAAMLMRRPGHRSLASVALTCGFFDQAHLNRDFRELAGCTPSAYLASRRADDAGVGMTA